MYDLSELRPSLRSQINFANLPERFIGMSLEDLDDYQDSPIEIVEKWIDLVLSGKVIKARGSSRCGVGLLLVGNPGHGKTTLASVVLQEVARRAQPDLWGSTDVLSKKPILFIDYPKLLRIQQKAWKDDTGIDARLIEQIYGDSGLDNIQLLVLDDLGKEHRTVSGWAENTFDALLRSRYNAGLPTIVTTNVPLKDWGTVYGEAMGSFAHEAFFPINIVSKEGDRRK